MQDKFIEIYTKHIRRSGSEALLEWLKSTDFFEAPASTRFHLSCQGGLVQHSVNVYERLWELYAREYHELSREEEETIAICGLLHDVCKIGFYDIEMRNRKNENGVWEKYPVYTVKDRFPYGHGEKSVYLISRFMSLENEEAMAIRWHMGAWQEGDPRTVGNAFEQYPLALLTHVADMEATYLDERTCAVN